MPSKPTPLWLPFAYSSILGAITLIGTVASIALTGRADVGMIPFLCFLPMAFYFVAETQRQTRDYVKTLETRILELEAGKASG